MVKYGDQVIKMTKYKKNGPPVAHTATAEVNGGIRTLCGLYLPGGTWAEAESGHLPCDKCGLHGGSRMPDRKGFTRAAYPAPAGMRR